MLRKSRKTIKKLFIAISISLFITLIMSLTAFSNGLGYHIADFEMDSTPVEISETQLALVGHIKVSLNLFLFPLSYICNAGTIMHEFVLVIPSLRGPWEAIGPSIGAATPWSNVFRASPAERAEIMAQYYVYPELLRNLPYYFLVGLLIVYLMNKFLQRAPNLLNRIIGKKGPVNTGPEAKLNGSVEQAIS